LPDGWDADIPTFPPDAKGLASRDASGKVENAIAPKVSWFLGGAADLSPSTKTLINKETDFEAGNYSGRNFHWGIREHAMGSILNGMVLSKLRAFGAGFLIFSDYMRNPIRLAALMDLPVLYIFTHDSIGLGEDGPTHQPIEQIMSLRAIPRLIDMRPADSNEVAEAWRVIMKMKHQPIALILSRQALPTVDRTKYASASGLQKGAYILGDSNGEPEVILIGTGSEVQLCVSAHEQLTKEGIRSRVISMPSWKLFEKQSDEYKNKLLPPKVKARIAVEAGTSLGWKEYVGSEGKVIARSDFGASAPIKELLKHFGFTVEHVVAEAKALLKK
jgi:transketolase